MSWINGGARSQFGGIDGSFGNTPPYGNINGPIGIYDPFDQQRIMNQQLAYDTDEILKKTKQAKELHDQMNGEYQQAQQRAMDYNSMEAQKARSWQEAMYGSRFQKTIADIKKAGLNPYILNAFSPGGFSGGSAAQIASNVIKTHSQNKSETTTKKQAGSGDWIVPIIGLIGSLIGSFIGPMGGAIGGAIGGLGARALKNRNK